MAFRGKGTQKTRATPCWCGAEVIITSGTDTDDQPYSFESCSADIFHDTSEAPAEPDLCSACGHAWHGLICTERQPVRGGLGMGWSPPCGCYGEARGCVECGHHHTSEGCRGNPTPSDLWAGVTVSSCDCDG